MKVDPRPSARVTTPAAPPATSSTAAVVITTEITTEASAKTAPLGTLFGDGSSTVHAPAGDARPRKSGIEKIFQKVVGAAAIAGLKAGMSEKPVVLIAGDQLTGKSTAAQTVAKVLGGEASGTGRLMRAAAAAKNLPVEEFVKTVDASFDVELDWQAAKKIAKGDVAVFESRLAGHLGQMLEGFGRKNVVSVYLVASPRERALRYLNRELSPEVRTRIEKELTIRPDATFEEAMAAVVALGDPALQKIAASMQDIVHRDDVDHARLKKLYDVDYQERSAFDVIVVTDGKTPEQVQAEIVAAVKARTA